MEQTRDRVLPSLMVTWGDRMTVQGNNAANQDMQNKALQQNRDDVLWS
jgi:hypothetical protein